jgi:hypothetical protein
VHDKIGAPKPASRRTSVDGKPRPCTLSCFLCLQAPIRQFARSFNVQLVCEADVGGFRRKHLALGHRQATTDVCFGDCLDSSWMCENVRFSSEPHRGGGLSQLGRPRQVAARDSTRLTLGVRHDFYVAPDCLLPFLTRANGQELPWSQSRG